MKLTTVQQCHALLGVLIERRGPLENVIGTVDWELTCRAVKQAAAAIVEAPPAGRHRITFETSGPVHEALAKLVTTGLFDCSVAEAAEQLLRERLRDADLQEMIYPRYVVQVPE